MIWPIPIPMLLTLFSSEEITKIKDNKSGHLIIFEFVLNRINKRKNH